MESALDAVIQEALDYFASQATEWQDLANEAMHPDAHDRESMLVNRAHARAYRDAAVQLRAAYDLALRRR